ncbi:MAG: sugar phosphate isomerase/epimerase [Candidatus Omnitrophica bacterium]|jgi:sugar phosphate isomerase/epimerase|nr:sugar phosphate isomerase/epimerase [Candidatus Omnitrophota bacterium]
MEIAMQSYSLRGYKENEKVIKALKEIGINKIELCGVHIDFMDESKHDEVIDLYKKNDIQIISIGVNGLSNNEINERKYCKFLKKAGAKIMSVDFDINKLPACLKTGEKIANEYDIYLAIHNHGGRHWLGSSGAIEYIFNQTGNRIGLCLDTAWALDSGEDPLEMAKKFKERLYSLHIKDFTFDSTRKPHDIIPGKGLLKLKELMKIVGNNSKTQYAIIEYEGDVDNPVPALKQCVEALQGSIIRRPLGATDLLLGDK